METIESIKAERDALKSKNEALLEQAKQLIGDLASAKSSGVKADKAADKAAEGSMRRANYDALSPWDQAKWVQGGGRVVD